MLEKTDNATIAPVKGQGGLKSKGEGKMSILDGLAEGCQILSLEWRYLYINKAAEIQNRRPAEEMIGKKYMDVWPGIEDTPVFKQIKECMNNKNHKYFENKFVFPDKSIGWFDLRVQPVPEGVFIMSIDITNKKLYEKEIIEKDEKFRAVFEAANAAKSIVTLTGELQVNKAYCDMLGYTQEELEKKTWQELTYPDDIEKTERNVLPLLEGKQDSIRFEKRYLHKKGGFVWADLSVVVHKDLKNQPQFLITTAINITEQKKIKEELEYNNRLLAEMGRVAKIVGWEYDIETGTKTCTKEAANLYDLDTPAVHNLGIGFYTSDSRALIGKTMKKAVKEKREFTIELDLMTAKGNHKWVRAVGIPVIQNEQVIKLQGSFQDITKEKKALLELEESHQRFATVFMYSPLPASLTKSEDMSYIEVNEAWCKVVGMNREEIIGKTPLQLGIMDEVEVRRIKKLLEKQFDIIKRDTYIYNKHGYKRYILASMVPFYEKNKRLNLNMYIDITERKNMLRKISEDERMMKTLLGNLPGMAYRCRNNATWDMEFLSEGCLALTGYQPEEFLSHKKTFNNMIHPDDREQTWKKVQLAIQDEAPFELEYRIISKENKIKWVWEKGKPTSTGEGGVLEGFIADITPRILAEQKLNRLNDELEERIKQRTMQLETMNKELQTFTYSVSHDLKAPLRGIDGYSKLLQEVYGENLEEEASLFVKYIREGTMQMNLLIEDLLTYSRLERNKCVDKKISFREIIHGILRNYTNEINERKIVVQVNVPDITIVTDYNSLSMALRNIIDNAFKFTKEIPSPAITILVEEKQETYVLEISDNGIGFDMKYHDKIFSIFQRLQRVEDYPGTGIGLALVAKAIRRIGGKVWADSKPGKKTTFSIELPKNYNDGANKLRQ